MTTETPPLAQPATPVPAPEGRLVLHQEDGIGWIVIDHPTRRNALTRAMFEALGAAVRDYAADPAVRVIVLRGAGDKAFISGGDISEFGQNRSTLEAVRAGDAVMLRTYQSMEACAKPTIAMIRGFCLGGGLNVAAACDLRFAADDARFAVPAAKLGVSYRFSAIERLANLVGAANTAEIMFTARQFDAHAALRMGLVNRVLPVAELENWVTDTARTIAANAPLTIAAAKRALREWRKDAASRDLEGCGAAEDACFTSADYIEGRTAFGEKRRPDFKGR